MTKRHVIIVISKLWNDVVFVSGIQGLKQEK